MKLDKILNKIKSQNKSTMKLSSNPFIHFVLRYVGLYLSGVFAILNIHPTFLNVLNFFLGLLSVLLILIDVENFKLSISLFLIAELLDLSDGNLARYYNISSFWGRFLDGMVDILKFAFLMIVIFVFCLDKYFDKSIIIVSALTIAASPIYHFIYDKYSSLARWCNSENKTKLEPYIRMKVGKRINFALIDLEYLFLFLIFLINDISTLYYLIYFYLLIHILKLILNLSIHTYYARRYMMFGKNKKRNN